MLACDTRTFSEVELGAYVVMPNHLHGIIIIHKRGTIYLAPTQEQFQKPVAGLIPTIIRTFKAAVTRNIARQFNATGIGNEEDLQNKTDYINANRMPWNEDDENPLNKISWL